jgi:ribonuclease T1
LFKRAWVITGIVTVGAMLGACNKEGSKGASSAAAASDASGASASQAPVQAGLVASGVSGASSASGAPVAVGSISRAKLPAEAAETLRLIKAGGPFPFSEDGVLFRNSAGMLTQHPRGYYRAYTVRTPGSTDRGQRRIVCGGARRQVSDCYYTEDYYASFRRIGE